MRFKCKECPKKFNTYKKLSGHVVGAHRSKRRKIDSIIAVASEEKPIGFENEQLTLAKMFQELETNLMDSAKVVARIKARLQ